MNSDSVILFDGHCVFCHWNIRLIHRGDKAGYFRFAAQQSPAGQRLLAGAGLPSEPTGVVLIRGDGRAFTHSDAVIEVGRHLAFPQGLVRWGRFLPRPLREWAYRTLGENRYRLFGRKETCTVPDATLRARFIEGGLDTDAPVPVGEPAGESVG